MSEKIDFDSKMKRLDEIIDEMNNSINLENNLKLYKEAKALIKDLEETIKKAKEELVV